MGRCGPNVLGVVVFLCVCGVGEACDGIVVGNGGVLPSGMRLVFVGKPACPTFVVRVSSRLSVHCLNTALWGFLLSFLPEFSF